MRGAAAGDAIEFVAPRSGLFGTSFDVDPIVPATGAPAFGDDEPPNRWSTILAVFAIVALIAAGVVAAAPWNGSGDAAPTPTSDPDAAIGGSTAPDAATGTTTAADATSSTLDSSPMTGGYLVDPAHLPDGFEVEWASLPSGGAGSLAEGWLELWATPSATRTSGSWLAIETVPYPLGGYGSIGPSAVRTAVGDGVGLLATDATGVVTLQVQIGDSTTVTLTSHGETVEELVRLATGLSVDEDGLPVHADTGFQDGYELVASVPGHGWGLAAELFDHQLSTASYVTPDGRRLVVTTLRADSFTDRTLYDFLLAPVPDDPLTGPQTFWAEGDLTLVVGVLDVLPGTTVEWTVDETTVLLSGNLPTIDLIDLVEAVRTGSRDEWRALYGAGLERSEANNPGELRIGPAIAEGTLVSGGTWQMSLSRDGRFGQLDVTLPEDPSVGPTSFGWGFDLTDSLQAMTTTSNVIVVAAFSPMSMAASLRVRGDWGARSEPLVAATDERTGIQLMVALADVSELGPFTVEVLDADGAVVETMAMGQPGA